MDPDTLWKELCMGLRGGAVPGAERGKKILLQQMGLLQQYFVFVRHGWSFQQYILRILSFPAAVFAG